MAVRSKRLYIGGAGAANAWTTVYTCPGGRTTIVQYISAHFEQTTSSSLYVAVLSGGIRVHLLALTGAFPALANLDCWSVLHPGDAVQVNSSLANGARFHISGAELLGVAS